VPASPSSNGEACIGDFFNFDFKDVGAAVVGEISSCPVFKTQLCRVVCTSKVTHYVSATSPIGYAIYRIMIMVY
jgi:hypothetical protein